MRNVLKRYDLDNFEVWVVGVGIVAFGVKVIEYYYSLLGGF